MADPHADTLAVVGTRLTHALHERATTLLAGAAPYPSVPLGALEDLRDFVVANLRHHHETEDELLWPRVAEVAPGAAGPVRLSEEHNRLDAALDTLAATPVARDGDRSPLHDAAEVVRTLVHLHLGHEELLLFPVLHDLLPPESWTALVLRNATGASR
jgi:hemerythrin-like domain-containing protein